MISGRECPVKPFRDKWAGFVMWNIEPPGVDTEVAHCGVVRQRRDPLGLAGFVRVFVLGLETAEVVRIRLVAARRSDSMISMRLNVHR